MRYSLLSVALPALAMGCSKAPEQRPVGNDVKAQAAAAIFSFMFKNNGSALKEDAAVYCIGFGQNALKDPSQKFLKRLGRGTPPIKPASSCHFDDYQILERASGKPSLLFNLSAIACQEADRCTATGGYLEANLSASGASYIADRSNGGWKVAIDPNAPAWIS